eukprot:4135279-Pyramimonas_sp.AAC.1
MEHHLGTLRTRVRSMHMSACALPIPACGLRMCCVWMAACATDPYSERGGCPVAAHVLQRHSQRGQNGEPALDPLDPLRRSTCSS